MTERFEYEVRETSVKWSYETVDEDGITVIVFFTNLILYHSRIGNHHIDYSDLSRAIMDSAIETRKRDVARLMEHGRAWDRWDKWIKCAEPVAVRYRRMREKTTTYYDRLFVLGSAGLPWAR